MENNYITSSCSISKGVIYKDEKIVFENRDLPLSEFLQSIYQHFKINYSRFYKMDGQSKLGWLATEILLEGAFSDGKYSPEDIGVVLANASASLDTDTRYVESIKNIASPALFVYTLPNIVIGEICISNQFKGENAFFINDKFDMEFMHDYVSNLINNNTLQACVCGWVELFKDEYKAVLYLVEKKIFPGTVPFTKENINKIYQY